MLQALERFQRESRAVSMHLDAAVSQMTERIRRQDSVTPVDMMRHQRNLRESTLNTAENVIRQGTKYKQLYFQL